METVTLVLTIIATMLGVLAPFTGLIFWVMSRFEEKIHADLSRIDANMTAAHARIDAMGARIDQTQSIIMRMLEKQGR